MTSSSSFSSSPRKKPRARLVPPCDVIRTMTYAMLSVTSFMLQLVPGQAAAAAGYPTVELGSHLSHLVVDTGSGSVYVGGQNHLYQLDSQLQVMTSAITGPVSDSDQCDTLPPQPCTRHVPANRTSTENYNKVLVVDSDHGLLISCGSVFQGRCEARSLTNISRKEAGPDMPMQQYAVAANSQNASTVAFIADGKEQPVLYVAATYTGTTETFGNRRLRMLVPALSIRSLHERDRFSFKRKEDWRSGNQQSSLDLQRNVLPTYLVDYKYAFASGEYRYFLTVQPESTKVGGSEPERRVTKIIQICRDDEVFMSYVDIPLRCSQGGVDYPELVAARRFTPGRDLGNDLFGKGYIDDVLLGVFTRTDVDSRCSCYCTCASSANYSRVTHSVFSRTDVDSSRCSCYGCTCDSASRVTHSAVCVFTMKDIRRKILENVKMCHRGTNGGGASDLSGGGYLTGGTCEHQSGLMSRQSADKKYMCNPLASHRNVVGTRALQSAPMQQYQRLTLTSVAVTSVGSHTVAFVGTDLGTVKKLILSKRRCSTEYDELTVHPGHSIMADMEFDRDRRNLYVMSITKVSVVPVETCGSQSTCGGCLQHGDPYCGWCSLENQCSPRASCLNSADSDRWLQGNANNCIYIASINPTSASVSKVENISLSIPQLPKSSGYTCVYQELNWTVEARESPYGVYCDTPDFHSLGLSLGRQVSHNVTIALNSTETGKLLVTVKLPFYNCSNFLSCMSCADSSFACDWCIYDNGCFDDSSQCKVSKGAGIVRGRESLGSGTHGSQLCPRIVVSATKPVYLPVDVARQILLIGVNIPAEHPDIPGTFQCVLNAGGEMIVASARTVAQLLIFCDIPKLNYAANSGTVSWDMSVRWGNNFLLETTAPLVATVYKCGVLADHECSMCLNLEHSRPQLDCDWCESASSGVTGCHHKSQCRVTDVVATCPVPSSSTV